MKKIALLLVVSFNLSAETVLKDSFEQQQAIATAPQSIFISGHSLIDNPFADYLAHIAQAKGKPLTWNQQIGIGSPIRVRTSGSVYPDNANNTWAGYKTGKNRQGQNMDVIAELQNPATLGNISRYDALLITERHDILNVIKWEFSNSLVRHYHDRLLAGNANAKTYLYHSWLDIDINAPQAWINHERNALSAWQCIVSKVNLTLQADQLSPAIDVVPAGWALTHLVEHLLNNNFPSLSGSHAEKLDLLFSDNVHLNPVGVFFIAAFNYAIIYGESPAGITTMPANIDAVTGQALLNLAWVIAQDYQSNHSTLPDMPACRQQIADKVCQSHFQLTNRPDEITSCQAWMRNEQSWSYNPFNWPDNKLRTWAAP